MRAVAYVRVSDVSQVEGHSLDAQERLFRELCKTRGWEASGVYREEGRSAKHEAISRRPVFQRLLEDARAGRFEVVVVHTLDRWSRNLKVTLETVSLLAQRNVGWVSITEQIDWSTPQGRLVGQMIGGFAEFFSGQLGTHVKKGISERAGQGRHLGGLPFGYESCWAGVKGKKEQRCDPEHPGGVHVHVTEGPAVAALFRRYAAGTATLATLASWLNEQGFRTRNMHKLADAQGSLVGGPRLFTTASVRTILHNPFYSGKIRHGAKLLPGAHEPLVSQGVFEAVQASMKRNSGRSRTLQPHPEREYLLKGLAKCAWCRLPMWSQTYLNGQTYYREHRVSRGLMACPAGGGSLPCHMADEQVGKLMEALVLPQAWMDRVLARIQLEDEVLRVQAERARCNEKLRRLGRTYRDGLCSDTDYERERRFLEERLAGLVVPEVDAAREAGRLLEELPRLWGEAGLAERRRLLTTMLEAVYIETREERRVVAIKPKPAFRPLLELATTREGSGVILVKETPPAEGPEANISGGATPVGEPQLCSWWRRGRVRLCRPTRFYTCWPSARRLRSIVGGRRRRPHELRLPTTACEQTRAA